MRINIPMVRNNMISDKNMLSKLKPGDKIRAKVLEIKGDLVRLELRGGEIVYGKSEIPLDFSNEKFMNFIIKELGDNILSLVPDYDSVELDDNYTIKNEKLIMNKVLESLGLEKNEENVELIKNMVKFRMPLDRDTVHENIKYLDKLDAILNVSSDEEVFVLNKGIDHMKEDIANFLKLPKEDVLNRKIDLSKGFEELEFKEINYEKEKLLSSRVEAEKSVETPRGSNEQSKATEGNVDKLKSLIDTLDRDIKEKIQGEPKTIERDGLKLERAEYKDVTSEVKSELEKLFLDGKLGEKEVQKIVFLNRSEVKVSLNNLKNLESFLNGENIAEDIERVVDAAVKDRLISPEEKVKIETIIEQININFKDKDGKADAIKEYNRNVSELIGEISEKISGTQVKGEELSKQVSNLNDKLDMYNRINEKSLFMFMPINVTKGEIQDKLYFMSKKRHGERSETIRAYISLDTANLSRVSALCDYRYGRLDIAFKVEKDKSSLFLDTKSTLESALSKIGYSDVNISVREEMVENILDMMSDESSINYMINIKV